MLLRSSLCWRACNKVIYSHNVRSLKVWMPMSYENDWSLSGKHSGKHEFIDAGQFNLHSAGLFQWSLLVWDLRKYLIEFCFNVQPKNMLCVSCNLVHLYLIKFVVIYTKLMHLLPNSPNFANVVDKFLVVIYFIMKSPISQ